MDIEEYVLEALQKQVTVAVSGTSLENRVKYVGLAYKPPSDGKWLEVVYIPNNIQSEFWDQGRTYRGVMRLVLHWPIDSEGVYPATTELRTIAEDFQKGDFLQDPGGNALVRIIENPNIESIIEESPQLLIPLTISYSCFKI